MTGAYDDCDRLNSSGPSIYPIFPKTYAVNDHRTVRLWLNYLPALGESVIQVKRKWDSGVRSVAANPADRLSDCC